MKIIASAFIAFAFSAIPAKAQQSSNLVMQCYSYGAVVSTVKRHNEQRLMTTKSADGITFEMWANIDTGSSSIVMRDVRGAQEIGCIAASGTEIKFGKPGGPS